MNIKHDNLKDMTTKISILPALQVTSVDVRLPVPLVEAIHNNWNRSFVDKHIADVGSDI